MSVAMRLDAVSTVFEYRLALTPQVAATLYNDITVLLRGVGVGTTRDRHKLEIPALYALYDALNDAGVDGTS